MSRDRGARLAAVLRVRKVQEEQARQTAMRVEQEAAETRGRLNSALADLAQREEHADAPAHDWAGTRAQLLARAAQVAQLEHSARQGDEAADRTRGDWLERHQRVSLLERLADAHHTQVARAVNNARQAAADDQAQARHGREHRS